MRLFPDLLVMVVMVVHGRCGYVLLVMVVHG